MKTSNKNFYFNHIYFFSSFQHFAHLIFNIIIQTIILI